MRKLIALLILVSMIVGGVAFAKMDRDSPMLSKAAITSGVIVGHGVTVYKLFFWASAASSYFALYDETSLGACDDNTAVRIEGGEATQYDGVWYDFGDDGIVFNTGLTYVCTNGGYVTVLYQ